MSKVSSKGSWRLADITKKEDQHERSREQQFRLAIKFSPSKNIDFESKIFSKSRDKLYLQRSNSSMNLSYMAPFKERLKTNEPQKGPSQLRMQYDRKFGIYSKLSPQQALSFFQQSKKIGPKVRQANQEGGSKRKVTIEQIKIEFIEFKQQIFEEIMKQKQLIVQIVEELTRKIDEFRLNSDKGTSGKIKQFQHSVQSQLSQKTSKLISVDQLPSKIIHQVNKFQERLEQLNSGNSLGQQQKAVKSQSPQSPEEHEIKAVKHNEKYNHIIQTINTLNQINQSPVDSKNGSNGSPGQNSKLTVQQYKRRIDAVSKSNDTLIPERKLFRKNMESPRRDSGAKTNMKLDKFYNAIEKLKDEINQIRQISDKRNPKKEKVIEHS